MSDEREARSSQPPELGAHLDPDQRLEDLLKLPDEALVPVGYVRDLLAVARVARSPEEALYEASSLMWQRICTENLCRDGGPKSSLLDSRNFQKDDG